jgi:hypothetical protein
VVSCSPAGASSGTRTVIHRGTPWPPESATSEPGGTGSSLSAQPSSYRARDTSMRWEEPSPGKGSISTLTLPEPGPMTTWTGSNSLRAALRWSPGRVSPGARSFERTLWVHGVVQSTSPDVDSSSR